MLSSRSTLVFPTVCQLFMRMCLIPICWRSSNRSALGLNTGRSTPQGNSDALPLRGLYFRVHARLARSFRVLKFSSEGVKLGHRFFRTTFIEELLSNQTDGERYRSRLGARGGAQRVQAGFNPRLV